MSEPLVIIGNGMAAARLVDELTDARARPLRDRRVGDEPRARLQSRAAVVAARGRGRGEGHRAQVRAPGGGAGASRWSTAAAPPQIDTRARKFVRLAGGATALATRSSCSRPARSRSGCRSRRGPSRRADLPRPSRRRRHAGPLARPACARSSSAAGCSGSKPPMASPRRARGHRRASHGPADGAPARRARRPRC